MGCKKKNIPIIEKLDIVKLLSDEKTTLEFIRKKKS